MKKITIDQTTFNYDLKAPDFHHFISAESVNEKVAIFLNKLEDLSYKVTLGIEGIDIPWMQTRRLLSEKVEPKSKDEQRLINVKLAREKNIKDFVLNNQKAKILSKEIIKNIYNDLIYQESKSILGKKELYRQEPIFVGLNKRNGLGFECLEFNKIPQAIDQIITLTNETNQDDNLIKKSLLIMTLFVYVHPYPDFNGRMSRLLKDLFLQSNQMLSYSYLIDFTLKIKYLDLIKDLNDLRFKIFNHQKEINLDDHLNLLYKWFMTLYIYIYNNLEAVKKLTHTSLQILLTIVLKTKTTNQKQFHFKEIEESLKLEITKKAYFDILHNLVNFKLLKKIQPSPKKIFFALKNI